MADPPPQPSEGSTQSNASAEKLSKKSAARAERAAKKERAKAERLAEIAKAKEERQQEKSLAKMAEKKILKDLSFSLKKHARSSTFACGGSISFKGPTVEVAGGTTEDSTKKESSTTDVTKADTNPDTAVNTAVVDDVQVRFGVSGSGFTVNFNKEGPSSKDFEHLLKACQPASFGRAGEAILDEKYRKAGKLDRSQFATTFCPYEAGIVDVVTQLLVPQHKHGKHTRSIKVSATPHPLKTLEQTLIIEITG